MWSRVLVSIVLLNRINGVCRIRSIPHLCISACSVRSVCSTARSGRTRNARSVRNVGNIIRVSRIR